MIIDPRAPRSTRLDWFDSTSSKRKRPKRSPLDQSNSSSSKDPPKRSPSDQSDPSSAESSSSDQPNSSSFNEPKPPKPPIFWIFRATLSDGSQFAIDPCNAQYSFTTKKERSHGVFPWEPYLRRLEVPTDDPLEVHELKYHEPRGSVHPAGSLRRGRANIFANKDIRSTAESIAATYLSAIASHLILTQDLLLTTIMDRKSNRQAHTNHVRAFREQIERDFQELREKGIKTTLLYRLEVKAGAPQRRAGIHWLR